MLSLHPDLSMSTADQALPRLAGIDAAACYEESARIEKLFRESRHRRVIFALDNSPAAVIRLFALMQAGVTPVIVAPGAPAQEISRLGALSAAAALIEGYPAPELRQLQGVESAAITASGVVLATSGSTGAPKAVFRSIKSLEREAQRYCSLIELSTDDHVVFASPIAHAYALGWLWACVHAGATIEVQAPTSIGAITTSLYERATIGVVTPAGARFVVLRRQPPSRSPAKLRMVMAGAGVVDAELETMFRKHFGIGLSRNYGSTETGALLAGLAPIEPNVIGYPMPGISYRLAPAADMGPGEGVLVVTDEEGREHEMGDIARVLPNGALRILGRVGSRVRRGERWVSPLEIETVLRQSSMVEDAEVRAVGAQLSSNENIIASIVSRGGVRPDMSELRAHCAENLAPHKVPDVLEQVHRIRRTSVGKATRRTRRRLSSGNVLAAAARAYKQSVLIFTLLDTGLLDLLAVGVTADEAALRLGLQPDVVETLFEIAQRCELLCACDDADEPIRPPDFAHALIRLERFLAQRLVTPDAVNAVLHRSLMNRPYDGESDCAAELAPLYTAAMHGPHRSYGRMLALRALRNRPIASVLEIGASIGQYSAALLEQDDCRTGVLLRLGRLCPELCEAAQALCKSGRLQIARDGTSLDALLPHLSAQHFDCIVIDNGAHGLYPGGDVTRFLSLLANDGAVVIDDIFLPMGSDAAIGLDWLTHGGIDHIEQEGLCSQLREQGFSIRSILDRNNGLHSVLLATKETRDG